MAEQQGDEDARARPEPPPLPALPPPPPSIPPAPPAPPVGPVGNTEPAPPVPDPAAAPEPATAPWTVPAAGVGPQAPWSVPTVADAPAFDDAVTIALGEHSGGASSAPPPEARSRGLLIGLLAGAGALVIAVVAVFLLVVNKPSGEQSAAQSQPSATAPVATGTPSATPAAQDQEDDIAIAPVVDFLDALVAGDASEALRLAGIVDKSPLVSDAVFAAGAPTGYSGVRSSIEQGVATVSADLNISGETATVTLTATKQSDGTWTLTAAPVEEIVLGDVSAVTTVNGVSVDVSASSGGRLTALPGTYVFHAAPGSALVTYGEDQRVTVGSSSGANTPVSFSPQVTEAGRQAAIDAVRATVEHCMLSDAFQPTACPNVLQMADPAPRAVTGITRSWTRQPEYTVVESGGGDGSTPSYGVRITGGDVHIAYEWRYSEADSWQPATLSQPSVFGSSGSGGTTIPVTFDETGVHGDYGSF